MDVEKSILKTIREAVGLMSTNTDFDTELIMHINSAIGKLNQNGVGTFLIVDNDTAIWKDLMDPISLKNVHYFQMVPLFVTLGTKILFDPPPPSNVEYHQRSIEELLWRLKIAYEQPYVNLQTRTAE